METCPKGARVALTKKLLFYLLLALLLSPLVVLFEYAQSKYRAHEARGILAEIQTLRVGTSTFADAAALVAHHPGYLVPKKRCTTEDCEWAMRLVNGAFVDVSPWLCMGSPAFNYPQVWLAGS